MTRTIDPTDKSIHLQFLATYKLHTQPAGSKSTDKPNFQPLRRQQATDKSI